MGGPLAKEGSSDKYEHTSKLLLNIFQCNCLHQEIHSHFWGVGGPLANIGSSANFGVLIFKASLLYYLGGSIGQHRFICQVLCSFIEGIYSQFTGGVDLPADLGIDLPNLSSQIFRCGHHRGLFILHTKDQ